MSTFPESGLQTQWQPPQFIYSVGLAMLVALSGSCSRPQREPVYPVHGQVLIGNRPAAQAFVVLHPENNEDAPATRPYGHTGNDGFFKLTTFDPDDGAPAGKYVVTVVWPGPAPLNTDAPDQLKGRYRDPTTTKLRATIQKEPTELAPFRLSP